MDSCRCCITYVYVEHNCTERVREREKEVVASVVREQEIIVSMPHLCIPLIVTSCSPWAAVVFPIFGFSMLTSCVLSFIFVHVQIHHLHIPVF